LPVASEHTFHQSSSQLIAKYNDSTEGTCALQIKRDSYFIMSTTMIRRTRLAPENIGVIVCGYPSEWAVNVVSECQSRGFVVSRFGLASDEIGDEKLFQVPNLGNVRVTKYGLSDARPKLELEIAELQREGLFVVVADTSEHVANVELYNALRVPFILQCKEAESLLRSIKQTEAAKTFAVISGHMNKRLAAFDVCWTDWARRYTGLFDEYEFEYKSSSPLDTPVSLMTSFSELANRDFGSHQIKDLEPAAQRKLGFPASHVSREFSFKNRIGTSQFVFRQSVDEKEAYAEGVGDSISFLAQKAHRTARPQVYSILDVAEQNQFLMTSH